MMPGIICGLMKKEYTVKLIRSKPGLWHDELVGKKFKVKEASQELRKEFWHLVEPYESDDELWSYISKEYCRVVEGPSTDGFKKVRSVRCL